MPEVEAQAQAHLNPAHRVVALPVVTLLFLLLLLSVPWNAFPFSHSPTFVSIHPHCLLSHVFHHYHRHEGRKEGGFREREKLVVSLYPPVPVSLLLLLLHHPRGWLWRWLLLITSSGYSDLETCGASCVSCLSSSSSSFSLRRCFHCESE